MSTPSETARAFANADLKRAREKCDKKEQIRLLEMHNDYLRLAIDLEAKEYRELRERRQELEAKHGDTEPQELPGGTTLDNEG